MTKSQARTSTDETENHSPTILKWPKSERPRERLLELGAEAVSTAELLAILIGNGERGASAVDVARRILAATAQSGGIAKLDCGSLLQVHGVGEAKAARILAAVEFGRRTMREAAEEAPRLNSSRKVAEFMRGKSEGLSSERFFSISVDVKNRPLLVTEIARGTTEGVSFAPREVFSAAVKCGASGVICVHNHPSGDPSPSPEDRLLTSRLREAAAVLGIRFLDHVILCDSSWYSFADSDF